MVRITGLKVPSSKDIKRMLMKNKNNLANPTLDRSEIMRLLEENKNTEAVEYLEQSISLGKLMLDR